MLKDGIKNFTIGPIYLYGSSIEEILENAKREIEIYKDNVDAILIKTYFGGVESLESVLSYLNESKIDIPYGINYTKSSSVTQNCRESFRLARQYGVKFVVIDSIAGYSYSVNDNDYFGKMDSVLRSKPFEKEAKRLKGEHLTKEESDRMQQEEQEKLHEEYLEKLEKHNKEVEELYNGTRKSDEEKDTILGSELQEQRKDNDIFVIGTIRDVGFFPIPGHSLHQDLTEATKRCDAILINSGSLYWMQYDLKRFREVVGSNFPIIIDSTEQPAERSLKFFNGFKPTSEGTTDEMISGANGIITRFLREPISVSGILSKEKAEKLKTRVMRMKEKTKSSAGVKE